MKIHNHHISLLIAVAAIATTNIMTTGCHNVPYSHTPDGDTIPTSAYAPLEGDTMQPIDLKFITGVDFPKYKIAKEMALIPDSVSLAASEETVASGNFIATLALDTVPSKTFYARLDTVMKHDTMWRYRDRLYAYKRPDKEGGIWRVILRKGESTITVKHLCADMLIADKEIIAEKPKKKK